MQQVRLNPAPESSRFALIRELCGHDELGPSELGPLSATALVSRALVDSPGTALGPNQAGSMTLADRDRLVIALYRSCFGDTVASSALCRRCGHHFDLDFSLIDVLADLDRRACEAAQAVKSDSSGIFALDNGIRFRLPTVEDERAIAGLPPERAEHVLLERCIVEGDPFAHAQSVQSAMEAVAPLASSELQLECAECAEMQTVDFDMVSFFLAALERERPVLLREVHCLARAYRWSSGEILDLPRTQRRAYAALIIAEYEAGGSAA